MLLGYVGLVAGLLTTILLPPVKDDWIPDFCTYSSLGLFGMLAMAFGNKTAESNPDDSLTIWLLTCSGFSLLMVSCSGLESLCKYAQELEGCNDDILKVTAWRVLTFARSKV